MRDNYPIKTICCIGAGYVGGPTMAVIAKKCPHIKVIVTDINEERIKNWNNKNLERLPVYEPGLDKIIMACRNENLFFTTQVENSIKEADMIFISVNTPTKTRGIGAGMASDLNWVETSTRQVARFAKDHTIVIEKSTLPVRTAETIKQILVSSESQSGSENTKTFSVLSNPEFLAEGSAINDLENPDRVLIGGDDDVAIKSLKNIYKCWVKEEKIITTNLWSSELSKLTANAFLAQRISSINSISAICEKTGANIHEVSKAVGLDKRIGNKFISPSPGFGGSCFKKDILNLIYLCKYYGLEEVAEYWNQVLSINNWNRNRISRIIVDKLFGTISNKKLAIFGFSFKANTNDTRESSAIQICKNLIEEGATLAIYDPKVNEDQIAKDLNQKPKVNFNKSEILSGEWYFCSTPEEAAKRCDAIIILTEWQEFNNLNWPKISVLMRKPSWLFDTRNIANYNLAEKYGMKVWRLGSENQ